MTLQGLYYEGALRHPPRQMAPHPHVDAAISKRQPNPTKGTPKSGIHQGDASIDRIRNMIPKTAIHWQGLVKAISRYRFKKQILRGRSREHGGSSCPEPWYHAASHGRSSTQVVLPKNGNPAGRRRRPFQDASCTTKERTSSRLLGTAVPVLKLYYYRTEIQPAAGDGRSSTQVVRGRKSGRRRRPFQYSTCTTRERKSSRLLETAVPVLNLEVHLHVNFFSFWFVMLFAHDSVFSSRLRNN